MEDFGCQPAFAADTLSAPEKEGRNSLCQPGHTQTKEKFIASALGSVNVRRIPRFFGKPARRVRMTTRKISKFRAETSFEHASFERASFDRALQRRL
jgi:hypothetical protein